MITAEQKSHFETFGFLVARQAFSPEEMDAISREFDDLVEEDRQGRPFDGEKRQAAMAFVERRPLLMQLADDDRIYEPIGQLLGPDFIWWGSAGNLYVGDTDWHPDASEIELGYGRIKVAFYLDPVAKDTGCLRVVPGSHRMPLHGELGPLRYWRVKQAIAEGRSSPEALKPYLDQGLDLDKPVFGVDARDVPGFPLESQPGDLVFFNQHVWHSSFGGRTGRRMMTLNYYANPTTDEQVDLIRRQHENSANLQALSYTKRDQAHEEAFMNSDRPRIKRMVAKLVELGLT